MTDLILCNCGQEYPITRESCPYCGSAAQRYWLMENGELCDAILSEKDGKPCICYAGKLYDDEADTSKLPQDLVRLIKPPGFKRIFLKFCTNPFFALTKALNKAPSKWDRWLSKENSDTNFSIKEQFENEKEKLSER